MNSEPPLLEMNNLKKFFDQNTSVIDTFLGRHTQPVQAVDGVTLSVEENESIGIIGESGCGKSTLLKTLMGLLSPTAGDIRFRGRSVSEFDRGDWRQYRHNVQMIFQDPYNALDPKLTVEETLREPLKIHGLDDRDQRIVEILEDVELDPPEQYIDQLPHQLSGGEKQRVSIARALIVEPDVILADEPVSMLDVSTQANMLRLLSRLIEDYGVAMIYISHDLSTVSHICQRINVMYLGRIVESAPTAEVIDEPEHPYSQALINAIPIPDPHHDRQRTELEGTAPDPRGIGEGCRFRDRCPERMDICEITPRFVESGDNRKVACHLYYNHDLEVADQEGGQASDSVPPGGDTA